MVGFETCSFNGNGPVDLVENLNLELMHYVASSGVVGIKDIDK
jgi:hypothetical protein